MKCGETTQSCLASSTSKVIRPKQSLTIATLASEERDIEERIAYKHGKKGEEMRKKREGACQP